FFFQAEDGIRDPLVTGVQTCALPISAWLWSGSRFLRRGRRCRFLRRGGGCPLRQRRHVAIGKFDVDLHARAHGARLPQRPPPAIAYEREAACEYAAMGERVEQLAAMLAPGRALAQRGFERPARPRAEAADAFAF